MNQRRKIVFSIVGFLFIVLILMAITGFFVYYKVCRHTVTFITENSTETKTVFSTDTIQMPSADASEGEIFVGWTDTQGNIENRSQIRISGDTVYRAKYITALNTEDHIPYMFPDENGFYRPHQELTRAEAAIAIYSLLCHTVETADNFPDVTEELACYNAVAQLKALGIVDGSQFYPDDGILMVDLIHWLASFYPPAEEDFSFSFLHSDEYGYRDFCTAAALGWIDPNADLKPNQALTRIEAAKIINRAVGRSVDSSLSINETGYLSDCGPFDDNYLEFAEAAVNHSYLHTEDGAEIWTESDPPKQLYSGYVMIDERLHYADENGLLITGYNDDGLYFSDDGCYTSGNQELDTIVREILDEITDDTMTREEKLHAAYDYVVDNFNYLARPHHDYNSTGWEIEDALWMFKKGRGNCYNYAAAFWALARELGYHAIAQAGTCDHGTDHGWVSIEEDGVWYIYDTEIEHTEGKNRWKLDRAHYISWKYLPDPQLTFGEPIDSD